MRRAVDALPAIGPRLGDDGDSSGARPPVRFRVRPLPSLRRDRRPLLRPSAYQSTIISQHTRHMSTAAPQNQPLGELAVG